MPRPPHLLSPEVVELGLSSAAGLETLRLCAVHDAFCFREISPRIAQIIKFNTAVSIRPYVYTAFSGLSKAAVTRRTNIITRVICKALTGTSRDQLDLPPSIYSFSFDSASFIGVSFDLRYMLRLQGVIDNEYVMPAIFISAGDEASARRTFEILHADINAVLCSKYPARMERVCFGNEAAAAERNEQLRKEVSKRMQKLNELRAHLDDLETTYGIVDRSRGFAISRSC